MDDIFNRQRDVLLAPYTSFKIGGSADLLVEVWSAEELRRAVVWARQRVIPYFILGCGANILVGDRGCRGLVIVNRARGFSFHGTALRAESGVAISDLIEATATRGLSGLEHFAGIPSTVGGAVWQNLHFLSPDRSRMVFVAEILDSATVLLADNSVRDVGLDFLAFGYDDSILHHQEVVVLEACFSLEVSSYEEIARVIEANKAWRQARHPQQPSAGSVFRQIEGVGAGRLIEQVGLKGLRIGGARVSDQHANFIVNCGGATARDVMELVKVIKQRVIVETGYELELEIGLVGEF